MTSRKSAAAVFAAIVDAIAAVIGFASALLHPSVQAARRMYREACA